MPEQRARRGPDGVAEAGMPGDPAFFKVMSEISMIAHLADTAFARVLPAALTPAQFGVLNRLARLRCRETVSQLASAFQVAQPTMTSTVRRLADKALVRFELDATDRRLRLVVITEAGERARDDSVAALAPIRELLARQAPGLDFAALLPQLTILRAFLDARRPQL